MLTSKNDEVEEDDEKLGEATENFAESNQDLMLFSDGGMAMAASVSLSSEEIECGQSKSSVLKPTTSGGKVSEGIDHYYLLLYIEDL